MSHAGLAKPLILDIPFGANPDQPDCTRTTCPHRRRPTLTQTLIIPDLHADPNRLDASLRLVPRQAQIAFLGDFIDAGKNVAHPDDGTVLHRVMALVETGEALAVMGNHELNALLFHRADAKGRPLRQHDPKNLAQHGSFCARFGIGTPEAIAQTQWFLTLPLWQDLGGLRLVHACWHPSAIATIAARRPDGRLREDDLEEIARKETPFARAVDLLLSGPEIPLPPGISFRDNAGHCRTDVRIAWWRSGPSTWREAALSVPDPDDLPDAPIEANDDITFYDEDQPPVLVGHYKMRGTPQIEGPAAACLDYPDAPCVYHWNSDEPLREEGLFGPVTV
ncbi:metallophosphoesterase [Roseinatronobacter ekhonensis]